jgi:hypothetical protein
MRGGGMMKGKVAMLLCIVFMITTLFAQAPDTLWTKTYGGAEYDRGYSVQQTIDGGYIIAGVTASFGAGEGDVWLLKTDSLGDTLWTKIYGGTADDIAYSVQQTLDQGYIIAGETNSFGAGGYDVYLIKTDSLGDPLWTKTYGGTAYDKGSSVRQTTDGGYILASVKYNGQDKIWFLKVDTNGDTLWTKIHDCSADRVSVDHTIDGGYIATGGDRLLKTDSLGDTLWTWQAPFEAHLSSAQQTFDGGYISTGGIGFNNRVYLVKTDANGDTIWTRTSTLLGAGHSIQQTPDSGYIITGNRDIWGLIFCIMRTDPNGDSLWTEIYGLSYGCGESGDLTSDGGYIAAGWLCTGGDDVYLVKLGADVGIEEKMTIDIKYQTHTPTILSGPLRLPEGEKCRVFDITGRVVAPDRIRPGIYFIEVEGRITQKVVKVR